MTMTNSVTPAKTTLRAQLELEIQAGTAAPEASAEELHADFSPRLTDYLTNTDGVLFDDFGEESWGGYDGPVVLRSALSIAPHTGESEPAVPIENIILTWRCPRVGTTVHQTLMELIAGGAAICPECDEDMEIAGTARISAS